MIFDKESEELFAEQEIAIHSRHVALQGYMAELERTFFVGRPSAKQREAFQVMVEAQAAGIAKIAPGVPCREVDMAARSIIQATGYGEYFIHRSGHGIGISVHEGPYLRFDNNLVLEENMVVSVEPGIYVPELGGFRHSDTILITKTGAKMMTDYPRELTQLIL